MQEQGSSSVHAKMLMEIKQCWKKGISNSHKFTLKTQKRQSELNFIRKTPVFVMINFNNVTAY